MTTLNLCPPVKLFEGGNLLFKRGPIHTFRMQVKKVGPQLYIIISTGDETRGVMLCLPFDIISRRKHRRVGHRRI